jgi:gamma-glutamyltranspeptidase / glutathione hydrolase
VTLGFPASDRGSTTVPAWARRREGPVFAPGGMVAAAHPLTVATGLAVLQGGGNAVDAAVAAALVAGVVMPEMCGLGGDLFAIVHAPGGAGTPAAILGSGIAPRGASIELMRRHGEAEGTRMPYQGPLSPGVPGFVDGAFTLLARWGSRPFAALAEAAIGYADDGFPVMSAEAAYLAQAADLLGRYPSSAAVFLPGGRPPAAGERLRQPDLARTLGKIAAGGSDVFYRGEIAREIGRFFAANGGALAPEDFSDHETVVAPPIATTYRNHTIYQTGLPTQGLIMLEALAILEGIEPAAFGPGEPGGVHLQAEALKLAYADRLGYAGDPAFVDTPLATLLSDRWAAKRRGAIDPARAAEVVPAGPLSEGETTYLCAVDARGLMISLIISNSALFGSGVVAGETGVLLNNRAGRGFTLEEGHPNVYAPGKKTMHTLNCYSVADPAGRPILVGGTPGGDGQPQWNLQVLSGLLDAGLDVQAAIETPRWTIWPGTDPSTMPNPFQLRLEERLGEAAIAELERRGHRVRRQGDWDGGGAAQAIVRDPETGVVCGGSDPRVEGMALGC